MIFSFVHAFVHSIWQHLRFGCFLFLRSLLPMLLNNRFHCNKKLLLVYYVVIKDADRRYWFLISSSGLYEPILNCSQCSRRLRLENNPRERKAMMWCASVNKYPHFPIIIVFHFFQSWFSVGFLFVWSIEDVSSIAGKFPAYSLQNMPRTDFTCRDKILGGYYADAETQCQMFHVCVKVAGVGVSYQSF